jgi:enamine deaminase RidA (YjgF/YER057c/UK114 family)
MDDFATMNAACKPKFRNRHPIREPRLTSLDIATVPNPKPARVCVTVANLGRGAKVEIDCVAAVEEIT